jgi:glycogen debranching enzyme
MPIEIKVAPPGITISQGRTFMATNSGGEINPQTDEGVFAIDTRFISYYHLFINRVPWVLVNSSQLSFYASRIYLTNPKISTEDGDIAENTIGLTLERTVEGGIHEDFYVTNYTGKKISITLELALHSDFADLFKIPHTPYYGTADATILYLVVLSETYRWTGDVNLLKQYHEVAEGCLNWIDQYGDLDGDGFQEYKTFSSLGYENVNWKDSGDAVVYADGSQVKQPKGTCELQGYVYDAKVRMAEVFSALGDQARAQQLLQEAEAFKRKFNEVYWMEDEGCYAYGQDGNKRLITSIASNAGHCLWSGIADQDQAERIAQRLLQEDMWSGWGIRTLSSKNPAYNPYSYHLGSVWPHDNGIIAA